MKVIDNLSNMQLNHLSLHFIWLFSFLQRETTLAITFLFFWTKKPFPNGMYSLR